MVKKWDFCILVRVRWSWKLGILLVSVETRCRTNFGPPNIQKLKNKNFCSCFMSPNQLQGHKIKKKIFGQKQIFKPLPNYRPNWNSGIYWSPWKHHTEANFYFFFHLKVSKLTKPFIKCPPLYCTSLRDPLRIVEEKQDFHFWKMLKMLFFGQKRQNLLFF